MTAALTQVEQARAIRDARHPNATHKRQGPLAEVLLQHFPPEKVREVVERLTVRLREPMIEVIGEANLNALAMQSEAAIQRAGGAIRFQVRVTASAAEERAGEATEHLVVVLAHTPTEAELVASQMVACRTEMPLSAHVVTDSTLTHL